MSQKCLLFVYGLLLPDQSPPRSVSQSWVDRAAGQLYDLGEYPCAFFAAAAAGAPDPTSAPPDSARAAWVEGCTLEIDADELSVLDEFEDVESGEFRRIVLTTESGATAWAYEYGRTLPPGARPISRWPSKV